MLSIRLRKSFGVDFEMLRHTLNTEMFTQVELVTLAHHAIEIANTVKQPEDHQARKHALFKCILYNVYTYNLCL